MNVHSEIDAVYLEQARAALQESFATSFTLWRFDDGWFDGSMPAQGEPPQGRAAGGPPAELVALLNETRLSREVCCQRSGSGFLLAVPLGPGPSRTLIATARFREVSQELLLRFARLFRRQFFQQQELSHARQDNDDFVRQVTNDFEELAYLRNVTDLLAISDLTFDLAAMAASVFPILRPLLQADSLLLLEAVPGEPHQAESDVEVAKPRCWDGLRKVEEEACRRLVQTYRTQCQQHPFVGNLRPAPAESGFPGVRDFVLAAVQKGDRPAGWLLALNRNPVDDLYANAPWRMSCAEFGTHEATLLGSTAAILATHAHNVEMFHERESLHLSLVGALASAIEAKDVYTRGHSERVALYARQIATAMGCDDGFCRQTYLSGLLHDVGKIGVRDAVLTKPGPLTREEFDAIKRHPELGWDILAEVELLSQVLPGVLHHHEQYDGSGYPDRLSEAEIPLMGRIIAVADAYDAMTSDRAYRPGMPEEKAEAILRSGSGQQWDPDVVAAFLRVLPQIHHIKHSDRPTQPAKRRRVRPAAANPLAAGPRAPADETSATPCLAASR